MPNARSGRPPEFNHAMVYVKELDRSLAFYRDGLGLRPIEVAPGYARLRGIRRSWTIGLHELDDGVEMDPSVEGLRLYFEVEDLDGYCESLVARGVSIDRMPQDMPWGWRHAYLHDPDGHEISLYYAGEARFRESARGTRKDRGDGIRSRRAGRRTR